MALIQKEVRKNTNMMSIREKEKRAKLRSIGLVKSIQHFLLVDHSNFFSFTERVEEAGRERDN